jgi:hypothetical protein
MQFSITCRIACFSCTLDENLDVDPFDATGPQESYSILLSIVSCSLGTEGEYEAKANMKAIMMAKIPAWVA